MVIKADDVFSLEIMFCCKEALLEEYVAAVARDFLMPNIEEKAALMLFRVARASCPKIGNKCEMLDTFS